MIFAIASCLAIPVMAFILFVRVWDLHKAEPVSHSPISMSARLPSTKISILLAADERYSALPRAGGSPT
jgi:hypothetical protein